MFTPETGTFEELRAAPSLGSSPELMATLSQARSRVTSILSASA